MPSRAQNALTRACNLFRGMTLQPLDVAKIMHRFYASLRECAAVVATSDQLPLNLDILWDNTNWMNAVRDPLPCIPGNDVDDYDLGRVDAWSLEKGDVLAVMLNQKFRLAICTKRGEAYDRQGGEGAIIVYEDGARMQFEYCDSKPQLMRLDRIKLGTNPLRDLLNWRMDYE